MEDSNWISQVALRKEIFDYHHDYEQQYCWSMVTLEDFFEINYTHHNTHWKWFSRCTKETEWTS